MEYNVSEFFQKIQISVRNKFGQDFISSLNIPSSISTIPVYVRVTDYVTGRNIEAHMRGKGHKSGKFFYDEIREL